MNTDGALDISHSGYSMTYHIIDSVSKNSCWGTLKVNSCDLCQIPTPPVITSFTVTPEPIIPGTTINLSVTAMDNISISKVEFYNGSTLLGSDTSSPYTYAWTNAANGSYTLSAKATDNGGAIGTSAEISVSISTVVENAAPTISLTDHKVLTQVAGDSYGFRHALLAEAVHDDLLPSERRRINLAYISALTADGATGPAAEIAMHAAAAGDLTRAFTANVEAAEDAVRVAGHDESAHHYENALEMVDNALWQADMLFVKKNHSLRADKRWAMNL